MQTNAVKPFTNHPTGLTANNALSQGKTLALQFASNPKFGEVPNNTTAQEPKDVFVIEGLSAEESEAIKKEMEAQQKQVEGLLKGLDKAFDVVTHGNQWLKTFQASPAVKDENIFDRLSSLYHLTAGRFREYAPKKLVTLQPTAAKSAEKPNPKETVDGITNPAANSKNQVASEEKLLPKPNTEAFKHYQKVLSTYSDLALKTKEDLPFDLGQKTALTSQKPQQLLTLLQNKRNEFKKIQDRIQAEAKQKQQKQELTEEAVPAFMNESLKNDPAYIKMLRQIQKQFTRSQ